MKSLRFYAVSTIIALTMNVIAQDVYISTQGSDENTGSKSSPFATLEKALESVAGSAAGVVDNHSVIKVAVA